MAHRLYDVLVVFACYVGIAVSMVYLYMMGPFFVPLQQELGWSRGEVAAGLFLASVISVLGAPLVGMAVDRFGSRRFAIAGLCVYCAGIACLALAKSPLIWMMVWFLLACGSLWIKPPVWLAMIAKRFNKRRGLAMGLALSGTGITAAIMPIVATGLIDYVGWRWAFAAIGLGAATLALPVTLLFFKEPPANIAGPAQANKKTISMRDHLQQFRSAFFLLMAAAGFCASFSIMALAVHFVPILLSFSLTPHDAALLASSIGIFSVIGRVAVGYLLDIWRPRDIGVLALCLPAVAALLLLLPAAPSQALLFTAGALVGLGLGAEVDVLSFLTARYFGPAVYGTMFGTLMGVMSLGLGSGPTFAAIMFDWSGSYAPVLIILALISVISSGLLFAAVNGNLSADGISSDGP